MKRTRWSAGLLTPMFVAAAIAAQPGPASRKMRPDDLFRVRRVGATTWSPDGRYATIEFSRPGRSLDESVPTNELQLLDATTGALRPLSTSATTYLGFFNAVWSPTGRRLAFLSVDRDAIVRIWLWAPGATAPAAVSQLDVFIGLGDTPFVWLDDDRLAAVAWEAGAAKSGPLYFRILHGKNAADGWARARDGSTPSVSVVESGGRTPDGPFERIVTVDCRTNVQRILARGHIHRLSVSPDHRVIGYRVEAARHIPPLFAEGRDAEAAYEVVNGGTERHALDAMTGHPIEDATVATPATSPGPPAPQPEIPLPRPDARRLSVSPRGTAALFVANAADGSHLWLAGGPQPLTSSREIWHANEWMHELRLGTAESIAYTAPDGTALTGWLLLPPGYVRGTRLPVVTIVYPGTMYRAAAPSSLSPYAINFEHPQLFAALGYAVLLPSMPPAKDPRDSHALPRLLDGVMPAVDAAIAQGVADPDRLGVLGQSNGGFSVLGLITQTTRFRSAVASASFSDLTSLYGTLYGQYRNGDAGAPETGQALRMLQVERGDMGMGAPPWADPDLYRDHSAIFRADKVQTPLMLVHGDLDFIPIQQAEEFFTALYRQDKRAELVRYQGEWHEIAARENVLDLWRRLEAWLSETLAH